MNATADTTSRSRYSLAPAIRVTFTADGATVLDTATGRIIAMNHTGGTLLRAIQEGAAFDRLYDLLAALPEAPAPAVIETELHAFLNGLLNSKLIVEATR